MSTPSLAQFEYEIGLRLNQGNLPSAAAAAAACRTAWPHALSGWLYGSIIALLADDRTTALALAQNALDRHPNDIRLLVQKAECLLALGRRVEAIEAAAAATQRANEVSELNAVGEFLVHAAENERALEIYDRVLRQSPENISFRAKRAVVHRFLGNLDLAAADFETVLTHSPDDAEALKGLAEIRRQTPQQNKVAAMESALQRAPNGSKTAATLHFGLAKSYEDLGDSPASWRHLAAGNRIERALIHYDPRVDRAAMENIIAGFPQIENARPDSTGEAPIFIVGLPRTGTTLVERMLGRHTMVHAAGELSALSEAIGAAASSNSSSKPTDWLSYARALSALDSEFVAREYLARAQARRGTRPRFTDKQPVNFFYCGLIFRAFPRAKIVHLTRHPLAACHAIYKTRFGSTYPFSYDLAEMGSFYIGYRRLMAHWHRVLPGRILDVAYEDVVTALEPTTRRLLEYLELPFEQDCLDFHLNPTATMTASAVQVRQPLYDSSLQLWKRYSAELAPLSAQLEAAGISIA